MKPKTSYLFVTVKPGEELPQPGSDLVTVSHMTGIRYATHVTSIANLTWGDNGTLHVTVRGHKRAYEPSGEDVA